MRSLGSAIGSAVGGAVGAVVSSAGLPVPGMGNVKKYAESGGGVGFGAPPVDWTISTNNVPVLDLGFVLSCWLDGLNVEAALAQLSKQPHTLPTQNQRILRNWITDNYRSYTSLEEFLEESPGQTFLEQVIWPLPLDVRLLLVEKYYGVDPIVMRQILGKKLNSRTRKEMEDFCQRAILASTLAEQRGSDKIPPGRARRTFDNVRNVDKKMEDFRERGYFNTTRDLPSPMDISGPIRSSTVGSIGGSFTFSSSTADFSSSPDLTSAAASTNVMVADDAPAEQEVEQTTHRAKGLQDYIATTYLLPPKLAATYTHVLFSIHHRFNHLTLPAKKRKLAHLKFNGIMTALKSMHDEWSDGWWGWDVGNSQWNDEDGLSRTMSNLTISTTSGLLPDLKEIVLLMKTWRTDTWEELRTRTVQMLQDRGASAIVIGSIEKPVEEPGTPSIVQPLSQVSLALPSSLDPKSPQNTFKNLVRPPLTIVSQLDKSSVEKEVFSELYEKCVEPIWVMGWTLQDVDVFLDALQDVWDEFGISVRLRDRFRRSWRRIWRGYKGIVHGTMKPT